MGIAGTLAILILLWGKPPVPMMSGIPAQAAVAAPPREVLNLQEAFVGVAEKLRPAVVNIATEQVEKIQNPYEFFFGDPFEDFFDEFFPRRQRPRRGQPRTQERRISGAGSGVIIDPEGYILTNHHVVAAATRITVTVYGREGEKKYPGKVVGVDPRTDLAVIKIKPAGAGKLTAAPLGDSSKIRVGDWAIAIGSPFGLEQTVTSGIISAKRQTLQVEGKTYDDMIQTDAAINRGNSGGPLLNIYGEVIGVNTAIFTPSGAFAGIGFAVPIDRAKEILEDLIHKGKVTRGWLGIGIDALDEPKAKLWGIPDTEGVLVNEVMKGGPAEAAGIRRGDVIRELNGKKVKMPADLMQAVMKLPPKSKATLGIIRSKTKMTVEVLLGERPATDEEARKKLGDESGEELQERDSPGGSRASWLGILVEPLDVPLARRLGISETEEGVLVTEVSPGSKAEEIGITAGDLIKSINQMPTKTVLDFERVTKKVRLKEGVVMDVLRYGRPIYLSFQEN